MFKEENIKEIDSSLNRLKPTALQEDAKISIST